MALTSAPSWDLPLDFYHLPFDAELPHDILEFSLRERDTAPVIDDYASTLLTPPPFSASEDDTFSFPEVSAQAEIEIMNTSDLLLGASAVLANTNWATTPPTSPPPTTASMPAPASRFPFPFAGEPFSPPESSSDDDIGESWSGCNAPKLSAPPPRRRKSSSGASKSRKSKSHTAAALAAFTAESSPASYSTSSDEVDEPENKRKSHNVLERKRRNDLKKSYQELRMQLPNLADNARAPTGHILTKAVEFIEELKNEEATRLQEIEELRQQNALAHTRLCALKSH